MKRIILLLLICLSTSIYSQSRYNQGPPPIQRQFIQERTRDIDIEEYLLLFEVDVEVWVNPNSNVISFEDTSSDNFADMLFQWSYMMTALDFMYIDRDIDIEEFDDISFVYTLFLVVNTDVARNMFPNSRYDIYMNYQWLLEFFEASRREKSEMMSELFHHHLDRWTPPPKQQRK